jgi:hypothetical protein
VGLLFVLTTPGYAQEPLGFEKTLITAANPRCSAMENRHDANYVKEGSSSNE